MPNTSKAAHAAKMNDLIDPPEMDEELLADQAAAEAERARVAKAPKPPTRMEQLEAENADTKAQLAALQALVARLTPAGSGKDVVVNFPSSERTSPMARLYEMFPDGRVYKDDKSAAQMRAAYVREQWGLAQDGKPHDRVWE